MWRHFPHHSHAICGEISDFYTSVTRRNLKLLHMWIKFRFFHICHAKKSEISPHDNFSPRIYPWDLWQMSGMQWNWTVPCINIYCNLVCMALSEWMIRSQGVTRSHHWGAGHHHGDSAGVTIVHRPDQLTLLLLFCVFLVFVSRQIWRSDNWGKTP